MSSIKIGIDRIELDNFFVSDLDIDYLRGMSVALGNVDIAGPCGARVRTITIRDNKRFQDLVIGHNQYRTRHVYYTILSLTPTNFRGHNRENMSWSEYNSYLQHVMYYIEKEYHIRLKSENMRVRSMEINCNIPLTRPYAEYDRVIRLMMSFLPKGLGADWICGSDPKKTDRTFLRGNHSMEFTIYNKTEQLRNRHPEAEKPECSSDLMRFELRLKKSEKIVSALGSNFWSELDDSKIRNYFLGYINQKLRKKYESWEKKRKNELIFLLKDMRREYPKTWHHMTMQLIRNQSEMMGIPYILDIEQVVEALNQLPDPHDNRSRARKALLGIRIDDDLYRNRDQEKIAEIFSWMGISD